MTIKYGFTLIELTMSLVVITILASTISITTELVRQARLKAMVKDLKSFKIAIDMFENSYNSLPGDLSNASDFWTSCTNQTTPVINNCNGDGDDKIQLSYEGMRMWEHLSLAELIPGSYVGKDLVGDGNQFNPGNNSPKLSTSEGCYNGESKNNDSAWYNLTSDIVITAGKTSTNSSCQNAFFAPEDSFYIDSKIDDAVANTGKILATEGDSIIVSNPNDCVNTDYNFDIKTKTCRILYNMAN